MTAARHHLAAMLGGAASPAAFSASRSAPTGDLQVEVRGVGPIRLPMSQAQARRLCTVARRATGMASARFSIAASGTRGRSRRAGSRSTRGAGTRRSDQRSTVSAAISGCPPAAAGGAALDAGLRARRVLRPAPGLREGRQDDRVARRRPAVQLHGWCARGTAWRRDRDLSRFQAGAVARRLLQRLPTPAQTGHVRSPRRTHLQPPAAPRRCRIALRRRREARRRVGTLPPRALRLIRELRSPGLFCSITSTRAAAWTGRA